MEELALKQFKKDLLKEKDLMEVINFHISGDSEIIKLLKWVKLLKQ